MIAGVLVVDKPQGITSHDVVVAARRVLGERRIGHCGTLDPLATGVLALAIGPATRLVRFLSGETKQYDAVIRFGLETTTYDVSGEVVSRHDVRPSEAALESALGRFRGTFLQVPPPYSAKKVGGVRAYALARDKGAALPPLTPVEVTVHALALTRVDGERAWLSMEVSAGFYVRSLAHDLGLALGSGAALDALRRTASGSFGLDQAVSFETLVTGSRDEVLRPLVPVSRLLPSVPALVLSADQARRVRHGLDVEVPAGTAGPVPALFRLVDAEGRLVALAVPGTAGLLHPSVVLGYD